MDGVGAGVNGGADDVGDVQVAVRGGAGTDADRVVGQADVQGVAVGGGVDGHRLDTQFLAGADDADGDFAAIGYENSLKHDHPDYIANPPSTTIVCPVT